MKFKNAEILRSYFLSTKLQEKVKTSANGKIQSVCLTAQRARLKDFLNPL